MYGLLTVSSVLGPTEMQAAILIPASSQSAIVAVANGMGRYRRSHYVYFADHHLFSPGYVR